MRKLLTIFCIVAVFFVAPAAWLRGASAVAQTLGFYQTYNSTQLEYLFSGAKFTGEGGGCGHNNTVTPTFILEFSSPDTAQIEVRCDVNEGGWPSISNSPNISGEGKWWIEAARLCMSAPQGELQFWKRIDRSAPNCWTIKPWRFGFQAIDDFGKALWTMRLDGHPKHASKEELYAALADIPDTDADTAANAPHLSLKDDELKLLLAGSKVRASALCDSSKVSTAWMEPGRIEDSDWRFAFDAGGSFSVDVGCGSAPRQTTKGKWAVEDRQLCLRDEGTVLDQYLSQSAHCFFLIPGEFLFEAIDTEGTPVLAFLVDNPELPKGMKGQLAALSGDATQIAKDKKQQRLAELRRKEDEAKQEEAKKTAELARKKKEEEEHRLAELKRQQEEALRAAELAHKKKIEEERRLAELKRQQEEAKKTAELAHKKKIEEERRLAELKRQQEEAKKTAELARKKKEEEEHRLAELKRQQEEALRAAELAHKKKIEEEEKKRRVAEARRKAEERRVAEVRAAEEARLAKRRLVASAQEALRALGLYKGVADGKLGSKSSAALGSWLTRHGHAKTTELDETIVGELKKTAEVHTARLIAEEKARLAAEAERKRKEEKAQRLAKADRKLFASLIPQAMSDLRDVQGFIKDNPMSSVFLQASIAGAGLQNSLTTKIGKDLEATVTAFQTTVAKAPDYVKFKEQLVAKRARAAEKLAARKARAAALAFAENKRELGAYKNFLAKMLSDSLGKDNATTQALLPIIQSVEGGLTSLEMAVASRALSEVKQQIQGNKKIRKAFDLAQAEFKAEKQRQALLQKQAAEREALQKQDRALAARQKKYREAIAVIIGNRKYANRVPNVEFAVNDARAMRKYLIELGYREGNIIFIKDATQAQLTAMFGTKESYRGKLFSYVRPDESDVTVFYSGHGVPGLKDRRGYLLPVDADPNLVELNGYPIELLYSNLNKVGAKTVRVYMDACFSGDSPKGMLVRATSGISINYRIPENRVGSAMISITAAQGDQFASWDEDAKHGLFTKHLLKALSGTADKGRYGNGDGKVTVGEVKIYLDREMTYQARRQYNRDQIATVSGDLKFVLSSYR